MALDAETSDRLPFESPAGLVTFDWVSMPLRRFIPLLVFLGPAAAADEFSARATPLLSKYCYECHGAEKQKGGIETHHPG